MTTSEFMLQLDSVFELAPGTLRPDTILRDIETFDSLKFLELIALADEQFHVDLNPEQMHKCRTIEDLLSLIGVGNAA